MKKVIKNEWGKAPRYGLFVALLTFGLVLNVYAKEKLSWPEPYEEIFSFQGVSKPDLFSSIRTSLTKTFNSGKNVIDYQDKDAGVITGKYTIRYRGKGMIMSVYDFVINVSFDVQIKDEKAKVVLSIIDYYVESNVKRFNWEAPNFSISQDDIKKVNDSFKNIADAVKNSKPESDW